MENFTEYQIRIQITNRELFMIRLKTKVITIYHKKKILYHRLLKHFVSINDLLVFHAVVIP